MDEGVILPVLEESGATFAAELLRRVVMPTQQKKEHTKDILRRFAAFNVHLKNWNVDVKLIK